MKQIGWLGAVLAASLAGCGGGGGGDVPAPLPAPPTALHLSGYGGAWEGACDDHVRETVSIALSPTSSEVLTLNTRQDYYLLSGCGGPILGTVSLSTAVNATFGGSLTAPVSLTQGATSASIKVDNMNTVLPPYTLVASGSGVTHVVDNGVARSCITIAGAVSACVNDNEVLPAQNRGLGLYLDGNNLYLLTPSGATFTVDHRYTKK